MKKVFIYVAFLSLTAFSCSREKVDDHGHATHTVKEKYTCPMHPQVVQEGPGKCPICGMDLVLVSKGNAASLDLMFNDTQLKLANITTQVVSKKSIGETTVINGRLVTNDDFKNVVSSRVSGRIEKLFVKETGRTITKGEPIYELYSEALFTLQKDYLLANEQYRALGSPDKHYKDFVVASEKKLLLYGLTREQISGLARSKKVQPKITFVSQVNGIVTKIDATEGQYIPEGGSIYEVDDISKLWVEAELYPSETSLVNIGDTLSLKISGFENTSVYGVVSFLSPEYKANSQITIIRASINNPGLKFKPGMQVQAYFTHSAHESLAVPADAVIRNGKGSHVYVQRGKNTFRPQMVKLGLDDEDQVEIKEGLSDGDTIVATGAYLLYSELVLKKGVDPMAGGDSAIRENEFEISTPPDFQRQLAEFFNSYLLLKEAFVESDAIKAKNESSNTINVLETVDMNLLSGDMHEEWMVHMQKMLTSLKAISSTNNIEAQRRAFSDLSNSFYKSIKTFRLAGKEAFYEYCPMAFNNEGAYWISDQEKIRNPYFGDAMLSCGEVKEKLK